MCACLCGESGYERYLTTSRIEDDLDVSSNSAGYEHFRSVPVYTFAKKNYYKHVS